MSAGALWRASACATLDARLDPASPAPIAVAVSGGGDSMALLHSAAAWARRARRALHVLTVDHGLHPGSRSWSEFVAEAADALGHPCLRLGWTGPKPTTGLPAAARAARHALLAQAAREAGARVILLGHTADDRAEGDWMRAEGSTLGRLRDWSPSPAWPEGRGLMLLRPLLIASRAELRAWLKGEGVAWLEDPANTDPRFARARARIALRSTAPGRGGSHGVAVQDEPSPDLEAAEVLENAPGVFAVSRERLRDSPSERRLLSAALVCASGGARPPSRQALAGLLDRLPGLEPFAATVAGARVVGEPRRVLIGREPGRRGLPHMPVESKDTVIWDGRFEVMAEQGGCLRPAAGRASRLTREDRAALQAAPGWVRPTLPVLETASGEVRLLAVHALAPDRLRAAVGGFRWEGDLP